MKYFTDQYWFGAYALLGYALLNLGGLLRPSQVIAAEIVYAPVKLVVDVAGSGSAPETGEVVYTSLSDESGESIRRPLAVEQELSLPLGSLWQVDVAAEGFWASSVLVNPGRDDEIPILLYPTIEFQGRSIFPVEIKDDAVPPVVRFRTAGSRDRKAVSEGEIECRINAVEAPQTVAWSCSAPIGRFDLRLRTPGFVSLFLWDQEIGVDSTPAIGDWKLRRGASLVGWVETEDQEPPEEGCSLMLQPRIGLHSTERDHDKTILRGRQATPNEEGFFHFEGLEAGDYVLKVQHKDFAEQRLGPILIHKEREAELGRAIVLQRPLELVVRLHPSIDSDQGNWTLVVLEQATDLVVSTGLADAEGVWRLPDLRPADYRLVISDSHGKRVKIENLPVRRGQSEFSFNIDYSRIAGFVSLGDEPLAGASLYFGGLHGSSQARLETDDQGFFMGSLPEGALPRLDLTSKNPMILRRFREIETQERDDGLWLELEIPDTQISGRVVDEQGEQVVSRIMTLFMEGTERPGTIETDEHGEFSLRAVALGEHRLEAYATVDGDQLRSKPREIELSEANPQIEVELIVRQMKKLRGSIVSAVGPVAGARIDLSPIAGRSWEDMLMQPYGYSDSQGLFEIEIPQTLGTADMEIKAPGFVFYREEVEANGQVAIRLRRGGGSLIVELPESFWEKLQKNDLHVSQSGQLLSLNTLIDWARVNGVVQDGARLTVPALEPGIYEVCLREPEAASCREGTLIEGETLVLKLKE